MNRLINALILLAALAFVSGTLSRFLSGGNLLGYKAVVYWRGAVGFLAFAVTLLLVQIRDK